ncbi:MAG: T9SS type A sorting domain-containing protein [Reichenbachiella sp.]|uniref:T9SS type A sorting domain-containing protein n=1 Tax=Reichenbachiella sp. TaxID=2184521 RepID=UPI003263B296
MNNRKIISLICIIWQVLLCHIVSGQSSEDWSFSAGGTSSDAGTAIAVDSLGNIYSAGSFQGESDFSGHILTSNGDTDIYLAKYSPQGKLIWVRQAGSNYARENTITEYPTAMMVTSKGVYLAGVFSRVGVFGPIKLVSAGGDDVFLARYSLEGKVEWVVKGGGQSQDIPYDLAVDEDENIYLTGAFQKKARFGQIFLHANNYTDMFLNKYGPNGDLIWAKQSFSKSKVVGKVLEVHERQIYIAGEFSDELSLEGKRLKSNGNSDIFLANYSLDGNLNYYKSMGSNGSDEINQIKMINEYLYMVGSFQARSNSDNWTSFGGKDAFLQKLNTNGEFVWNKTLGGAGIDVGQSLGSDSKGNIIVVGNFNDQIQINDSIHFSQGFSDLYLSRFNDQGELDYFETRGGSNQDHVNRVLVVNDRALITGFFTGPQDLRFTSFGASDIFLTSINLSSHETEMTKLTYVTYPNPSEGEFLIVGNSVIKTIVIYNQSGIMILNDQNVNNTEHKINLLEMPNGVYVVEINGSINKKIIIY